MKHGAAWEKMLEIKIITERGIKIAIVQSGETIVTDAQAMLDLLATVDYNYGCDRIVLCKGAITEAFFNLSTGIAGDVLQKVVNYRKRLAIVGDFSAYSSKALRDFIYESNKGSSVFFVETEEIAIARLTER